MGEEEQKMKEETKQPADEKKPEESKDDKDGEESKDQTPPPPPEIVLKVYMHCEGCARKVRRSLKGFQGVEDVITDCKTHKVIVKGEKTDPVKVLERVQRKSHGKVELISPIPKPPPTEAETVPQEKKEEEPKIITVVLKVHMHCEACAQEIQRRILKMKGVESAEADLKKSEVSVKGVFEAEKLVEFVHKRTGKQAVIVKQEAEKAEEAKEEKEEKKAEAEAEEEGGGEKEKKEGEEEEKKEKKGEEEEAKAEEEEVREETKVVEMKRSEYQYYPPRDAMEMYAYPPQIFSDENPNACSVM